MSDQPDSELEPALVAHKLIFFASTVDLNDYLVLNRHNHPEAHSHVLSQAVFNTNEISTNDLREFHTTMSRDFAATKHVADKINDTYSENAAQQLFYAPCLTANALLFEAADILTDANYTALQTAVNIAANQTMPHTTLTALYQARVVYSPPLATV